MCNGFEQVELTMAIKSYKRVPVWSMSTQWLDGLEKEFSYYLNGLIQKLTVTIKRYKRVTF